MNFKEFAQTIPANVKLIAVSKMHPAQAIQEAYDQGLRAFGENKPQEMAAKFQTLPKDIEWHQIGHLQTNKIKLIAPFVYMIHSVDSPHLLEAINKEAARCNRIITCLLQVHIAREETKFGFTPALLLDYLNSGEYKNFSNVSIGGLMGMATNTSDTEEVKNEFSELNNLFLKIKTNFFANNNAFCQLSMGMSSDYKIAIECGSTMVRIGTLLFGERDYGIKK